MGLMMREDNNFIVSLVRTDSNHFGQQAEFSSEKFQASVNKYFGNPTKTMLECIRVLGFPLTLGRSQSSL